jgi:hypothetical protein
MTRKPRAANRAGRGVVGPADSLAPFRGSGSVPLLRELRVDLDDAHGAVEAGASEA